jgi:hypothetical protein
MAAVRAERNKRKAAEARTLAAEQTVAALKRQVEDLQQANHVLQIAQAHPSRSSLRMLSGGLLYDEDTRVITGLPLNDGSAFSLGGKPS